MKGDIRSGNNSIKGAGLTMQMEIWGLAYEKIVLIGGETLRWILNDSEDTSVKKASLPRDNSIEVNDTRR